MNQNELKTWSLYTVQYLQGEMNSVVIIEGRSSAYSILAAEPLRSAEVYLYITHKTADLKS